MIQNFMYQLELYQLKILQGCLNNYNLILKEQFIGKKYQPKVSTERQNQYLDFLNDPTFQGVNRLFVLSFENEAQRTR